MIGVLAALAVVVEVASLLRRAEYANIPRAVAAWGLLPAVPCLLAWAVARPGVPAALQIAAAVLLVVPLAPLVARIVFQPIADASVLILLIVSLALHFLLSGLGLLFFGPEGSRTAPLASGSLALGDGYAVSGHVVLMVASAIVLSGLFFLVFEHTVTGKALRATAVNRVGARLVGIRPARTALLAYGCASLLGGLIGVLIAPVTTMYYDSGFIIGLKAFVAAIIGGLVSYPLTAVGGLAVGLVESFASFWSGALKDVIVFSLLIPVLMLRSFLSIHAEDDDEDVEQ
jgi:branched-chain amino acid transport system permease protein